MKLILVRTSPVLSSFLLGALVGCSGSTSGAGATGGSGNDLSGSGSALVGTGATSGSGGTFASGGALATGGLLASGGALATGGDLTTGGTATTGGAVATGGTTSTGGAAGTGGGTSTDRCEGASLVWKTANKTNYESYPDPGSDECVIYNGCTWQGQFAGCSGVKSEAWVEAHNIAALFPGFNDYKLHDICIKSGSKVMIVTVYDTCGDSDCDGCCTENKGSKDALIDLEKYTNQRFGVQDGPITWADLGPSSNGCAGE